MNDVRDPVFPDAPILFRAFAYRDEFAVGDDLSFVTLFFEAPSRDRAAAIATRLLSLAWHCSPDVVALYGLVSEDDLLTPADDERDLLPAHQLEGDVRLLREGYHCGPVTTSPGRMMVVARPGTVLRLHLAQIAAAPIAAAQRAAAKHAAEASLRRRPSFLGAAGRMARLWAPTEPAVRVATQEVSR